MRCVLKLKGSDYKVDDSVQKFIQLEEDEGFYNEKIIENYSTKIAESKKDFIKNSIALIYLGQKFQDMELQQLQPL